MPLLLTITLTAALVPQGQAKLPTIASPAHATILQGVPAQPNAHPLTATT